MMFCLLCPRQGDNTDNTQPTNNNMCCLLCPRLVDNTDNTQPSNSNMTLHWTQPGGYLVYITMMYTSDPQDLPNLLL